MITRIQTDLVSGKNSNWFFDPERKLVYIKIPRCAGTSLLRGGPLGGMLGYKTKEKQKFISYIKNNFKSDFNKYKFFIIVRNPLDRFVSCYFYLSKINKLDEHVSFQHFCKCIDEFESRDIDILDHTQPMCDFLYNIKPNYIIRFENLYEEWKNFAEEYNMRADIPFVNCTDHVFWSIYYPQKLRDMMIDRYKKDFEKFNYPIS